MGQRHQIFLIVNNPIKQFLEDKKNNANSLKKEFGTGDFTVLAFHNQWLYGGTALVGALNVLDHVSQFTVAQKTDINSWSGYDTPFGAASTKYNFNREKYLTTIQFILNFVAKKTPFRDAGLLGGWYLNDSDPEMRTDFTRGDNNDGITIIDTINNKYCFMNIQEYSLSDSEGHHSASDLPYLTPSPALDYIKSYYGETVETCNPYHIDKLTPKAADKVVKGFAKRNATLSNKFKKYNLLTVEELSKYFPKLKVALHKYNSVTA
jgi:hypothetical protein